MDSTVKIDSVRYVIEYEKHRDVIIPLINRVIKDFAKRKITHDLSMIQDVDEINSNFMEGNSMENTIHFINNDHHIEHFTNGVSGMNFIQLVEFCCDILANLENGDIPINEELIHELKNSLKEKYNLNDQMSNVLYNTLCYIHQLQP